jgi:hypothetical protein
MGFFEYHANTPNPAIFERRWNFFTGLRQPQGAPVEPARLQDRW